MLGPRIHMPKTLRLQSTRGITHARVVSTRASARQSQAYTIVGAGFAGLATAWHLLSKAEKGIPVRITIVDQKGVGGGASGAAAGLVHPFSPKGAECWLGSEGLAATRSLVAVAQAAADVMCKQKLPLRSVADPGMQAQVLRAFQHGGEAAEPVQDLAAHANSPTADEYSIVKRLGILRVGAHAQQTWELVTKLQQAQAAGAETCGGVPVTAAEAAQALPGLSDARLTSASVWQLPKAKERPPVRKLRELGAPEHVGVLLKQAFSLHPQTYTLALLAACHAAAGARSDGSTVDVHHGCVSSGSELAQAQVPDAVILATGAAAVAIEDVPAELSKWMSLDQGYTAELQCSSAQHTVKDAWPSLLGMPYAAVHGSSEMIVGSTKEVGLSSEQAGAVLDGPHPDTDAASAAGRQLHADLAAVWSPAQHWRVAKVRSGVRAVPLRTIEGAPPLMGRLRQQLDGPPCWLFTGLGSRGLLYHAVLAERLADAVLCADESLLPAQVRRWQQ